MSLTRRSLLGLAVAAALAGCRPRHESTPAVASADEASVEAAIDAERGLLEVYAAAIATSDAVAAGTLTAARDRHEQHLLALVSVARPASPTRTPTPGVSPTPADPAALVSTLTTSVAALQTSATRARDSRTAGLLASVAAEHATDVALGPEPS